MAFEWGTHHIEKGSGIRGNSPQMCPGIPSAFVTDARSCSLQPSGHRALGPGWRLLLSKFENRRIPRLLRLAAGHSARRRPQHLPIQDDHISNWLIDVSNNVNHLLNVLH
jgi:hypothetical protein